MAYNRRWLVFRAEDLVRLAKKGDGPDKALPRIYETRDKSYVSTGVVALVPTPGRHEVRWGAYVFPHGRSGQRPWESFQVALEHLQREAATLLAEHPVVDPDSWRSLYRELGLLTEFQKLSREVDPYVRLRALVAERELCVTFAEDLLKAPASSPTMV